MIARRKKEVAKWIVQFDARKIVYLDIPQQIMIYGENATKFMKEKIIDSQSKCENTATMDKTNNDQSKIPAGTPESGTKQHITDHSEPEQVIQDVNQTSVNGKSGDRDEVGEKNDENKNDEPNAHNTFESGNFALKLDTLLFSNVM